MTDKRDLLILYGSQTGYAEDTARRISRQAWRRHFTAQVLAMDQIDIAARFWRLLLRKSIPHDALDAMAFAVFGLGDSSYQKFNFPAKRLCRRLAQLGAAPMIERGDGDDQHYLGVDGALDPWLDKLWGVLLDRFPLPAPIVPEDVPPDAAVGVELADSAGLALDVDTSAPVAPESHKATLVAAERISAADHFQDVRHFRFELEDHSTAPIWNPGDCATLRPSNLQCDVDEFLDLVGWTAKADALLQITPKQELLPSWLPTQTTLRWLCTHYFDITAVPRRSFFEMLFYFSQHDEEREKLHDFSSSSGQDDLHAYCMRPRRTIVETLSNFPHSRIPLAYMFDILPAIAERSFSISSACAATPATVDLTVAIVHYKTLIRKPRVGLCTKWLMQMPLGQNVGLRFTKGTMKLPTDPTTPIIMVGPGTGIAAFMAFIQQRRKDNANANYLFFGCRSESKDFYYRRLLEEWVAEDTLRLFCAFSRDQIAKLYVQDRIRQNAELMWSLIDKQKAAVYVSGNANRMPDDVRHAFIDVVAANAGVSSTEAEEYVKSMVKAGRYQEECWY
ncbi:hypothetical protein BX070DRAFT_195190 [Coemansia spiralis]|nr:hypothetical protein BX070DRAFT_195190 [Coemansia spiralis]